MKSISSIFLLVLFGIAMLHPAMPYIEYELNKSYIAANLCENIDKPVLQCNGACHLKKQIQKQSEEKDKASSVLIDAEKLPIAVLSPLPSVPTEFIEPVCHHSFDLLLASEFHSDIFHPPTA